MNYRTGMACDVSAWPITSYGWAAEPVSCSRSADCGVVRPRRAGIRVLSGVAVCPVKMTLER
jgi:hypothetical protein